MNSALSSLSAHWRPAQPRTFNGMGEIQQRVAEHYGLQTADLRSGCKKPEVAAARAMAFMLCRKKGFSWASIGREFECHYTTAYKAQRKMANLAVRNADVKREFERLEK